jgi:hypothetical protein
MPKTYRIERHRWQPAPAWWVKAGPIIVELHLDRWGLGVAAAPWYIAGHAGPIIVSLGKRQWSRIGERLTIKWDQIAAFPRGTGINLDAQLEHRDPGDETSRP